MPIQCALPPTSAVTSSASFIHVVSLVNEGYLEVNWDRVLHVTDPYFHDKKRQRSVVEK